MKRLLKKVAKLMWRGALPIRRPLNRKVESYLTRCLRPTAWQMSDEMNTVMEHLVRELVRLQRQVDYLQQTIEELVPESGKVAIAGEITPEEKLKAG